MKRSKEDIKKRRAMGRLLGRYLKRKKYMSDMAIQILSHALANAESKVSR